MNIIFKVFSILYCFTHQKRIKKGYLRHNSPKLKTLTYQLFQPNFRNTRVNCKHDMKQKTFNMEIFVIKYIMYT